MSAHVGCTAVRLGEPGRYRYRLPSYPLNAALSIAPPCTGKRPPRKPRRSRSHDAQVAT